MGNSQSSQNADSEVGLEQEEEVPVWGAILIEPVIVEELLKRKLQRQQEAKKRRSTRLQKQSLPTSRKPQPPQQAPTQPQQQQQQQHPKQQPQSQQQQQQQQQQLLQQPQSQQQQQPQQQPQSQQQQQQQQQQQLLQQPQSQQQQPQSQVSHVVEDKQTDHPSSSSLSSKNEDTEIKVQSQKFIEKVNTRTRQIFEQLDAETQSLDRREEQALHQLENSVDRFRNMYKIINSWEQIPVDALCAREQSDCLKCFKEKSDLMACAQFIEALEKCSSQFLHKRTEKNNPNENSPPQ